MKVHIEETILVDTSLYWKKEGRKEELVKRESLGFLLASDFGICQKSPFGVITLADVVNPILYGLC